MPREFARAPSGSGTTPPGAALELHNVHLTNGEAPEGGAVALYGTTKYATLTMYGGSISVSKAVGGAEGSQTNGGGGAVLLQGSGDQMMPTDERVITGLFIHGASMWMRGAD